jgi:Ferritin-like
VAVPAIKLARPLPDPVSVADKRALLADLLTEAAELEHTVMAMYLFAAFGLKVSRDEGVSYRQLELIRKWKWTLLQVARQEMEHLGIVSNLLTAIGEAPAFRARTSVAGTRSPWVTGPFELAPLSVAQVLRFVCFEMPAQLDPADEATMSAAIPGFKPSAYDGLYRLYEKIGGLLGEIDESVLFVGPPSAQTSTSDIFPASIRGVSLEGKPAYNVTLVPVSNRATALAAVTQITDEGEGASVGDPSSHFAAFLGIYRDLTAELEKRRDFEPSRPVVVNPTRERVTDPTSRALMELFDASFAVLVELLAAFFTHANEDPDQIMALQRAAFFPMMTTVIRPLGEMLTRLPCETGKPERAGASFDLPRRDALLPHPDAAWRVINVELESLRDQAGVLKHDQGLPPELRTRLELMWENLVRVASDFALRMGIQ